MKDKKTAPRKQSAALAKLCHEFRAPLSSVIGFAAFLLKKGDALPADKIKLFLNHILTSGNYLLNLTNGLMQLSKGEVCFESDSLYSEIDAAALAVESLSIVEGALLEKEVKLVAIIPENLPPLRTIPSKLQVILINLISNAIKNTAQGAITLEIVVDAPSQRVKAFEIRDSGKGVEKKRLQSLLKPFSLSDSSSWEERGSLGLAITCSLCKQLGYTLEAESTPGVGSAFKVLLERDG